MNRKLFSLFFLVFSFNSLIINAQTLWLDETQVSRFESGWGQTKANLSVDGNNLKVGGRLYKRGVGTHATGKVLFKVFGNAVSFNALVGVDDEAGDTASVEFFVLGDTKVLWKSGVLKKGDSARRVNVSLKGIERVGLLVTDAGDGIDYDHADWLEARIEYTGKTPEMARIKAPKPYILTPPAPDRPRINYPRVTGASPGKPFLFRIPVTGKQPLTFSVTNLPQGLTLDNQTGIITGVIEKPGNFTVLVKVTNAVGKDSAAFRINTGPLLALSPPMGWNSWNCWGLSVDQDKVKAAANAMISKGLVNHGWTYINIDDGWEAPARNASGEIMANGKFPDMKDLANFIHQNGLKIGIYSSPGEKTCGGFLGSFGHESQDARTWSDWGIDYLKYDWCSYSDKVKGRSLLELKNPYYIMRDALLKTNRAFVFSLCQYGMGNVWEWGASVGGNCWRTTGDISDNWKSMAGIGFSQLAAAPFTSPGHWNDPDMLVVGKVGWGPGLHQTQLTPDEQYTHISLWSLLSAPLLIGCDMSQLDDFTLNLLTNDEVIAVNQDPRAAPAKRASYDNENEVYVKDMEDGTKVVGFFFTRPDASGPAAEFQWVDEVKPQKITVSWAQLGLEGEYKARDLWRQKDLGVVYEKFVAEVPWHGCMLIRLSPLKK
ncbi:MAG: NPCBM/NEW2 domain-containing protein [Bacteroidetes bacterium]|nr:NPCBM/NEW2 domain-containing protein [Bacteroidota bacterium]